MRIIHLDRREQRDSPLAEEFTHAATLQLLKVGGEVELEAGYSRCPPERADDWHLNAGLEANILVLDAGIQSQTVATDAFGPWVAYNETKPSFSVGFQKDRLKKLFKKMFDFGWGAVVGVGGGVSF